MKKSIACLALPLLAACASSPDAGGSGESFGIVSKLHPYRIDVRQGNMVTEQMAAQLKPGLTKEQVRFILGTPLLTDVFHGERWDYVYRLQAGEDGSIQQRHLIVFFEGGKLARLGGDVVAQTAANENAVVRPATRMIEIKAPAKAPEPGGAQGETAPQASTAPTSQ